MRFINPERTRRIPWQSGEVVDFREYFDFTIFEVQDTWPHEGSKYMTAVELLVNPDRICNELAVITPSDYDKVLNNMILFHQTVISKFPGSISAVVINGKDFLPSGQDITKFMKETYHIASKLILKCNWNSVTYQYVLDNRELYDEVWYIDKIPWPKPELLIVGSNEHETKVIEYAKY